MEPETFESGSELFAAMEVERPDCLVLDLQMPGIGGLDLLQYFARAGVRIPVIVITAHDEVASQSACLAAGAAAYLRKPLDAPALIGAIEDAVG
jgi:FixJ family two-component response regulator